MKRTLSKLLCLFFSCASLACGADGKRITVGIRPGDHGGDGGVAGAFANAGRSGAVNDAGIALGPKALTVHVEDIQQMTIEIVTVHCAGACADVIAVAQGGHAPYTFKWDDGSTAAKRRVCPSAHAQFSVTATDTAVTGGEFPYAAHTTSAKVNANVLACADGGALLPVTDGGNLSDASVDLQCRPLALPLSSSCANRSDGIPNLIDNLALQANQASTIRVAGTGSYSGQGWHYEIWGSSDGCALDEKLDAFQLANGPIDVRSCVQPKQAHAHVVLFYRFAPTDGLSLSTWSLSACASCAK